MVLKKRDESGRRQMPAEFAAALTGAKWRGIVLISEALGQTAGEMPRRIVGIVGVVAPLLARQQHVHGVMNVVVPLPDVVSRPSLVGPGEITSLVLVVL